MFRVLGFLTGIGIFLTLGLQHYPGYIVYLTFVGTTLLVILLLLLFRLLARAMPSCSQVWNKRLQYWIEQLFMGFGNYDLLPHYTVTHLQVDTLGNRTMDATIRKSTFVWGLVQMFLCIILTALTPLLVLYMLFCYAEALSHQQQAKRAHKHNSCKGQQLISALPPVDSSSSYTHQKYQESFGDTQTVEQSWASHAKEQSRREENMLDLKQAANYMQQLEQVLSYRDWLNTRTSQNSLISGALVRGPEGQRGERA